MSKIIVDVTLPIYNESLELRKNTLKLYRFLKKEYGSGSFRITIADNGSSDNSLEIAKAMSREFKEIHWISLAEKGRGRAIKKAWQNSPAEAVAYMDIDLSTNLEVFPKLVKAIRKDSYDLAVGSRLLKGSRIYKRPLLREVLSRGLNLLIKVMFQTRFSDAQCGFKVFNSKRKSILNKIADNEWFFDSELLIYAEKSGLKIYEEPVIWVDNPGSTVRVLGTVTGDFLGLLRLFFTRPWNKYKIEF